MNDKKYKIIFGDGQHPFQRDFLGAVRDGWTPHSPATFIGNRDKILEVDVPTIKCPQIMIIMMKDEQLDDGWTYKKETGTRRIQGDPMDAVLEIYEMLHGDGTIRLERLWRHNCSNAKDAEGERIECILPGSVSYYEYSSKSPAGYSATYHEDIKKFKEEMPDNKIFWTFKDAKEFVKTWIEENPID